MNVKKALIAVVATMGLLFGTGVAYANSSSFGEDEEADGSYKGSIAAPDQSGASLQELANIDQAAAEKAALEVVPGTVLETELEADDDNRYVVYDVEVAGDDGKTYDLEVDAGNGEILNQGLEEDVDEADGSADTEDADGAGGTDDADESGETEDAD